MSGESEKDLSSTTHQEKRVISLLYLEGAEPGETYIAVQTQLGATAGMNDALKLSMSLRRKINLDPMVMSLYATLSAVNDSESNLRFYYFKCFKMPFQLEPFEILWSS